MTYAYTGHITIDGYVEAATEDEAYELANDAIEKKLNGVGYFEPATDIEIEEVTE